MVSPVALHCTRALAGVHSSRKLHPITARAVILSFYAIYHWSIHQKKKVGKKPESFAGRGLKSYLEQLEIWFIENSLNYSFLEIGVRNSASQVIMKPESFSNIIGNYIYLFYFMIYFRNLQMLRYFSNYILSFNMNI